MVFNVVAGNIDDHDKNISFLMDKSGNWSLAPAYDVVYSIDPDTLYSQKGQFMSINGKHRAITIADFLAVARIYCINRPERIIESIMDIVAKTDLYLREDGVNEAAIKIVMSELNDKHAQLKL